LLSHTGYHHKIYSASDRFLVQANTHVRDPSMCGCDIGGVAVEDPRRPVVGRANPSNSRIVVDFPGPAGPRKPNTSPERR
jgi:hypothetical protein